VAETVETIRISSNIASVALTDAKALDRLVDAVAAVKKSKLDVGDTGAKRVAESYKAATGELEKQVALEAKILSFDAQRARQVAQLEAQYAKMNRDATKGISGGGEKQGGLAGMLGLSEGAGTALAALGIAGIIAGKVAGIVEEVAGAAARITYATADFAIKASDFRSEAEGAFTKMLGSEALASGLYDKVLGVAMHTGMTKEKVFDQTRRLIAAGFHADEIPKMLQSFADLEKVKGEGTSKPIEKLLEKVTAADKFDAGSVKALAKQGISTEAVYTSLEKKLGKTREQVIALLKTGQIKGDTGIDAVLETLDKKFGGAAKADSVMDLLSGIKLGFESLFDKVDTGPMKEALSNVMGALAGPAGAELKSELTQTIGALFHTLFDPFKGEAGKQRLERMLHTMSGALRNIRGAIEAAAPVIEKLVDLIDRIGGSDSAEEGTSKIDDLANVLVLLGDAATGGTLSALLSLVGAIEALADTETPDLGSLGSDMIDGLIGGIESGADAVAAALGGVVEGAVSKAKELLGIASPSKVFEKIGDFTAKGMAVGLEGGSGGVERAAGGLAGAATGAAYQPAGTAAGAPARASGFGASSFQIAVHMPTGAQFDEQGGQAMFREFERNFRRMQRDLAEQKGGISRGN
jgi:hypothetical protein